MKMRVHEVGLEKNRVVVIDDAHPDPERLRAMADAKLFQDVTDNYYPGVRSEIDPKNRDEHAYVQGLCRVLAPVIYQVFGIDAYVPVGASFSLMTKRAPEMPEVVRVPHYDGADQGKFAILHFLSPVTQGGTAFYRHNRTGIERISLANKHAYHTGIQADVKAFGVPENYITGSTEAFEETAYFEGHFNRLLIYSGAVLHAARVSDDFSYSPDSQNGRLTANLFVKVQGI